MSSYRCCLDLHAYVSVEGIAIIQAAGEKKRSPAIRIESLSGGRTHTFFLPVEWAEEMAQEILENVSVVRRAQGSNAG